MLKPQVISPSNWFSSVRSDPQKRSASNVRSLSQTHLRMEAQWSSLSQATSAIRQIFHSEFWVSFEVTKMPRQCCHPVLQSCPRIRTKLLSINSGHKMPRQGSHPVLQSFHMECTKMLTLNCGHHLCRDKAPVLFSNPVEGFGLYAEYKFWSQNAETRLPSCSAILSHVMD